MHQLFHSTQTWTFPGRTETITSSNKKSNMPGPADYSSTKVTNKAPVSIIGTQKRQDPFRVTNFNPGPGTHNLKSHIADGPKRTMSARLDLRPKYTPGPQDYSAQLLRTKKKEPAFSMSTKSKDFRAIVTDNNLYKPSPDSYEAKGSFNNPKGVIGTSRRRDLTETQKTPGPGTYLTIDQLEKTKMSSSFVHPRCSIGSTFRNTDIKPIAENPGPGAYDRQAFWDQNKQKKKGYSMRPRTADLLAKSRTLIPGPGEYQETLYNKTKAPGFSCGSEKRLTFIDDVNKTANPGPGTHEPHSERLYRSISTNKFSSSPRKDLYENQKTPGPSYYDPHGIKVLNKAPGFAPTNYKYNLDEYLGVKNVSDNPGPNVYDPRLSYTKQGSRMSEIPHNRRFDGIKQSPGPGYYNIHKAGKAPAWKFNTQKRIEFTYNKEAQGANIYEIPGMIPNPPSYMKASNYVSKMSKFSSTGGFRTTR